MYSPNYQNPYNQYNYGYQPQYNYNPYMQQQVVPQVQSQTQAQTNTNTQNNTQSVLQGWYVDSYDVTKAINADMSGGAMYFPSTDGKEIYKKQLDINTGKSVTYVYKLEDNIDSEPKELDLSPFQNYVDNLKDDLSDMITELKDMISNINITTTSTSKTTKKAGGK